MAAGRARSVTGGLFWTVGGGPTGPVQKPLLNEFEAHMTWRIRLRDPEACEEQPFLSPDLVIKSTLEHAYLDFDLAEPSERRNRGGLRSREALATAILIQLFTDARARDDDMLPDPLDPDRRGWWADNVARVPEQGEYGIGSRLWILRRATLSDDTAAIANAMVHECLQPIVDQGAVAQFEVETSTNYRSLGFVGPSTGILNIEIRGYGQDGTRIYEQRFEVLWDQVKEMRGSRGAFVA
jgi:phage gp46-like protein